MSYWMYKKKRTIECVACAALAGAAVLTAWPVMARTPAGCPRDPRCQMAGYYPVKNPVVIHHDDNSHDDVVFIAAGLVAGLVIGYAIWSRPVDITRATVRF